MKNILFFVLAFIGMQMYYSCTSQTGDANSSLVSNSEMNITLDGMTCAEGCAKTIEKTVSAMAGVTYSKVNFEEKKATFKFDDSKTTEKEILDAIAALNEGQYKVTNVELKVEKTINEGEDEKEMDAIEEELMNDTAV